MYWKMDPKTERRINYVWLKIWIHFHFFASKSVLLKFIRIIPFFFFFEICICLAFCCFALCSFDFNTQKLSWMFVFIFLSLEKCRAWICEFLFFRKQNKNKKKSVWQLTKQACRRMEEATNKNLKLIIKIYGYKNDRRHTTKNYNK